VSYFTIRVTSYVDAINRYKDYFITLDSPPEPIPTDTLLPTSTPVPTDTPVPATKGVPPSVVILTSVATGTRTGGPRLEPGQSTAVAMLHANQTATAAAKK